MNLVYIGLILVQVGVILFLTWRSRRQKKTVVADPYMVYRSQVLSVTPAMLKLNIPNSKVLVYGMVMDWDIGEAVATIAAYITGAASMYFSTGGGKTDGGKDPIVGETAVELVTLAQELLDDAAAIAAPTPPTKGFVTFYFLTNHRVFQAQVSINSFNEAGSQWAALFQKANELVNNMHNSSSSLN